MQTANVSSSLANLGRIVEHELNAGRRDGGELTRAHDGPSEPAPRRDDEITAFRRVEKNRSSLKLNLTTQDGDKVSLKFVAKDVNKEGFRIRGDETVHRQSSHSSERLGIEISGNIDEEEREALQIVVDEAFELAKSFFSGDDVDTGALLDSGAATSDEIAGFSLKLGQQSKIVEQYRTAGGDKYLDTIANESSKLKVKFQSFAEQGHSLISRASEILDESSATSLVKKSIAVSIDEVSERRASAAPEPVALPQPQPIEAEPRPLPLPVAPEPVQVRPEPEPTPLPEPVKPEVRALPTDDLGRPVRIELPIETPIELPIDRPAPLPPVTDDGANDVVINANAPDSAPVDIPQSDIPQSDIPQSGVSQSDVPVGEVPADDVPVDDLPADDVPGDDVPGDDVPGDDVPGDDVPGDDVTGDDVTGGGSAVDSDINARLLAAREKFYQALDESQANTGQGIIELVERSEVYASSIERVSYFA